MARRQATTWNVVSRAKRFPLPKPPVGERGTVNGTVATRTSDGSYVHTVATRQCTVAQEWDPFVALGEQGTDKQ